MVKKIRKAGDVKTNFHVSSIDFPFKYKCVYCELHKIQRAFFLWIQFASYVLLRFTFTEIHKYIHFLGVKMTFKSRYSVGARHEWKRGTWIIQTSAYIWPFSFWYHFHHMQWRESIGCLYFRSVSLQYIHMQWHDLIRWSFSLYATRRHHGNGATGAMETWFFLFHFSNALTAFISYGLCDNRHKHSSKETENIENI